MNKILALDIGSTIGWAHHGDKPGTVECGEVTFNGDRAKKLSQLAIWLKNFLTFCEVDLVVYERPFARGQAATRMGWGMAGVIEAVSTLCHAAVTDVHNASVKKFATQKGGSGKDLMTVACWEWGVDPQGEHSADAVCILKYTETNMDKMEIGKCLTVNKRGKKQSAS